MITLILAPGGGSRRNRENSCSSADCCGVGGKLIGKEEEGEEVPGETCCRIAIIRLLPDGGRYCGRCRVGETGECGEGGSCGGE